MNVSKKLNAQNCISDIRVTCFHLRKQSTQSTGLICIVPAETGSLLFRLWWPHFCFTHNAAGESSSIGVFVKWSVWGEGWSRQCVANPCSGLLLLGRSWQLILLIQSSWFPKACQPLPPKISLTLTTHLKDGSMKLNISKLSKDSDTSRVNFNTASLYSGGYCKSSRNQTTHSSTLIQGHS